MTSALESRSRALSIRDKPVTELRYVEGSRAEALGRLGIRSADDLARHYPLRYIDLTSRVSASEARPGVEATVVGFVRDIKVKQPRPRLSIVEIALGDSTGTVVGTWFNQPYISKRFAVGDRVAFLGKVELDFGMRVMKSPLAERLPDEDAEGDVRGRVLPVHPATEGLSTNWMRRLVAESLMVCADRPDHLPADLRIRLGLLPLSRALKWIHFPPDMPSQALARQRLAFDELFLIQIAMATRRHRLVDEARGVSHVVDGPALASLVAALPFELTPDQLSAVEDTLSDMAGSHPMNRMLLGDVGTGKTVVAAHALAVCRDTGTQAVMMAPTEVLASQYASAIGPLLDAAGVSWDLLTGGTAQKDRERILARTADGGLDVIFGTHALLEESVVFQRLSLVIVDEQHRFGVNQRRDLRSKGVAPDVLVMTATPIPRSLALTVFGDLATSYLKQRPVRTAENPITTKVIGLGDRAEAYRAIDEAVKRGRQAYIVCPLVEESADSEAVAANKEAKRLSVEVFPHLRVGLLTGRMRPAEKRAVMDDFRAGSIDVLVSTTVIEVGVDVHNASVMLVEHADRFGLAQLHQLRGRIGRGEHAGTVFLAASPKTKEGGARMRAIAKTHDGFELAELDLELRGQGQFFGERQHGMPDLRIARLSTDMDALVDARAAAVDLVARDPELDDAVNRPLRDELRRVFGDIETWVLSE